MTAAGHARTATATGLDAREVAHQLLTKLDGDDLRLVLVFADSRIDSHVLAKTLQENLPAPVVGCTSTGVIGSGPQPTVSALGLYGDEVRAGIGLATDLDGSALAGGRDALQAAAAALGVGVDRLDPARHVAITLVDASRGYGESFCIGSAASAPQIRVVGTCAASDASAFVWSGANVCSNAGVVVLLETTVPFEAVTSQHMIATDVKTVVTAANELTLEELDGKPAAVRLRELVEHIGGRLDPNKPWEYAFARFVDGIPYLRSMLRITENHIELACGVAVGQVLRLMRPGDLIGSTQQELAAVRERIGGDMSALVLFSCMSRHWEAADRGTEGDLAATYDTYSAVGLQSAGEQTGMLLVNHTLTGLALGVRRPQ